MDDLSNVLKSRCSVVLDQKCFPAGLQCGETCASGFWQIFRPERMQRLSYKTGKSTPVLMVMASEWWLKENASSASTPTLNSGPKSINTTTQPFATKSGVLK